MTYANFKDMVCSYSNRIAALYSTVGAQDVVLLAMNDARRQAQRLYKFNLCKRQAFVKVSVLPQSMLTDFDADPSGSGALVIVNRLDELWEYGTATVAATTCYYPTKQLLIRRRAELEYAAPNPTWPNQHSTSAMTDSFAYSVGTNIYHSNLTVQTWYLAFVVEFLADHAGASVEDIFLTYFTDWLKWATLANLNYWLKENERIQVDAVLVASLWNSVTQFDSQHEAQGPITLD